MKIIADRSTNIFFMLQVTVDRAKRRTSKTSKKHQPICVNQRSSACISGKK
jgi:hypothetical protein